MFLHLLQLNLSHKIKTTIEELAISGHFPGNMFDEAQRAVLSLLDQDTFTRFKEIKCQQKKGKK